MRTKGTLYRHVRSIKDGKIQNLGGCTIAYEVIDANTMIIAMAICHPEDNFCKKLGRDKAGGRLKSKDFAVILKSDINSFHKVVSNTDIEDIRNILG